MIKNILILIFFFYFLVLIQGGFLIHFNILGKIPNLVLIFLFIFLFLEEPRSNFGFFSALLAGFFLDLYSGNFFGQNILILLILSYLLKRSLFLVKNLNFIWLSLLLTSFLIFYNLSLTFILTFEKMADISQFQQIFKAGFFIEILYNLILGITLFYFLSFLKKVNLWINILKIKK